MPKFLGIDYGLERCGIAVSDPEGKIVFPLCTLRLKDFPNRKTFLDKLATVAIETSASIVVVGLPLHLDGSETLSCRQARNMAARLGRRLSLPLYFMPETLSTVEAMQDLRSTGMKRHKIGDVLDQQAACRILASFLAQPESAWMRA